MSSTISGASLNQPQTNIITLEQLAEIYFRTTANAIYLRRFRNPMSLPPPIIIPGQRRLFWNRLTVENWFNSFEHKGLPLNITPSKRGARTKAERILARNKLNLGPKD